MTKPLPPLVPVPLAADYLGVDPRTIRRWVSAGLLTAVRVGPRLIRVHRESLLKLAEPVGGRA